LKDKNEFSFIYEKSFIYNRFIHYKIHTFAAFTNILLLIINEITIDCQCDSLLYDTCLN